jgi:hypothetical protein
MADKSGSQNFSEDPDPRENGVSGDDITPSQEQRIVLVTALVSSRLVGADQFTVDDIQELRRQVSRVSN